ncbi:hypothetical protein QJS66_02790 [Kocuria rhizophila]|nr:hypothetical protein QJS66_02790 [Kocuria rhizophila]
MGARHGRGHVRGLLLGGLIVDAFGGGGVLPTPGSPVHPRGHPDREDPAPARGHPGPHAPGGLPGHGAARRGHASAPLLWVCFRREASSTGSWSPSSWLSSVVAVLALSCCGQRRASEPTTPHVITERTTVLAMIAAIATVPRCSPPPRTWASTSSSARVQPPPSSGSAHAPAGRGVLLGSWSPGSSFPASGGGSGSSRRRRGPGWWARRRPAAQAPPPRRATARRGAARQDNPRRPYTRAQDMALPRAPPVSGLRLARPRATM